MRLEALGLMLIALATGSQSGPKEPTEVLPYTRARMYPSATAQVWNEMLTVLKEMGLKPDRIDKKAQTLFTRWERFDNRRFHALVKPLLPAPYQPIRFQLHVFVSPFVEPARVYLGSIVDAENTEQFLKPPGGLTQAYAGRLYNLGHVEKWVLDRLSDKLGGAGHAIPRQATERAALGRRLLANAPAEACLRRLEGSDRPEVRLTGGIKPPSKIAISDIVPIYPGRELDQQKEAVVLLQTTVSEDGSVWDPEVLRNPQPSAQFAMAAQNAVSLWRFSPVIIESCPVPAIITIEMKFSIR